MSLYPQRNQTLTPKEQVAFTEQWGAVEAHPLGTRADTHPDGVPKEVGVQQYSSNPWNCPGDGCSEWPSKRTESSSGWHEFGPTHHLIIMPIANANEKWKLAFQNDVWHSDLSCMERPPSASFLYALKVPHRWSDVCLVVRYVYYTLCNGEKNCLLLSGSVTLSLQTVSLHGSSFLMECSKCFRAWRE